MLNQPGKSSTQPFSLHSLQQLIHHYPFAFWSGLWSSLVVITALAALGLLRVEPIEEEPQPSPTVAVVQPSAPQSQTPLPSFTRVQKPPQKEGLPLWLFGVIGLSCATGSLLIARYVNASPPRKLTKRTRKAVKPPVNVIRKKRPQPSQKRPARPLTPALRPTGIQPSSSLVPIDSRFAEVTIIPASEKHPLDWNEDNLAELMDLRKKHSLASLLRNR